MLSETHLNNNVHSSEIFPSYFNVFRCDRSMETEKFQHIKKKNGGGVLIAVDKSYESQCIGSAEHLGAEQIWVRIKYNEKNLILAQLYIRPDSPLDVYVAHMNALRELLSILEPCDILLLSGDFNLPNLIWYTDDIDPNISLPINASSRIETTVIDTCYELGLQQICNSNNERHRRLDLVWTNDSNMFSCNTCDNHLLYLEIHHRPLEITFHDEIFTKSTDAISFLDYTNANYTAINTIFDSINWNDFLSGNSLNNIFIIIIIVLHHTAFLRQRWFIE
jgi:hypothetical protein